MMLDRERIQRVIRMLKGSSSAELAVREGDLYVRVRRLVPEFAPAAPGAPVGAAPASGPAAASDDIIITGRLVGRFYHGKGPGQPSLVKIGDRVSEGQVVATVEALGKLTGVPASGTGDVIEFLTPDDTPVGYGAPLLRLRRPRT